MARLNPVNVDEAQGKAKDLLEGVKKAIGATPNLIKTFALSPAVLEGYLGFSGALKGASLSTKLQEQIALAVAGTNGCDYCASVHTAVGGSLGVSADELALNLRATASDPAVDVVLKFARAIVETKGFVSDEDIARVREAGYSDAAIAEIVAVVALNIFTNTFNHVAGTEIDFPIVRAREDAVAA